MVPRFIIIVGTPEGSYCGEKFYFFLTLVVYWLFGNIIYIQHLQVKKVAA